MSELWHLVTLKQITLVVKLSYSLLCFNHLVPHCWDFSRLNLEPQNRRGDRSLFSGMLRAAWKRMFIVVAHK